MQDHNIKIPLSMKRIKQKKECIEETLLLCRLFYCTHIECTIMQLCAHRGNFLTNSHRFWQATAAVAQELMVYQWCTIMLLIHNQSFKIVYINNLASSSREIISYVQYEWIWHIHIEDTFVLLNSRIHNRALKYRCEFIAAIIEELILQLGRNPDLMQLGHFEINFNSDLLISY